MESLFAASAHGSNWPFASLRSRPLSDQHRTHAESRSVANDPEQTSLATCAFQLVFVEGTTLSPRKPELSIIFWSKPDALISSMNSLM
jgi:hypothetical protein